MSEIKYLSDEKNIENKSIILRSDFNVPISNQLIKDNTRIDICIPFIKELLNRNAKIFIISHLGRPTGENNKNFTLKPVFQYLKKMIPNNVFFYEKKIDENTKNQVSFLKKGELLLFENIRFNSGEIKNDDKFSKNLSSLGEIYINDAFSCSHRKQASIHKITKYIKDSYAGPLFMKELNAINLVMSTKKKPVTCIIGGAKISTKIGVILSLIEKIDNLIVVGAMANNFLKFKEKEIGKSLIEEGSEKIISEIYNKAKDCNCKILIPEDFIIAKNTNDNLINKIQNSVSKEEMILDIGPKTIEKINKTIDVSNIVLWNGPAGFFENKNFSKGTVSIAKKISNNTVKNSLISIVGGGDTISAIKNNNLQTKFTHLSTAGGAFLEYIEGKNLPGIEVLK